MDPELHLEISSLGGFPAGEEGRWRGGEKGVGLRFVFPRRDGRGGCSPRGCPRRARRVLDCTGGSPASLPLRPRPSVPPMGVVWVFLFSQRGEWIWVRVSCWGCSLWSTEGHSGIADAGEAFSFRREWVRWSSNRSIEAAAIVMCTSGDLGSTRRVRSRVCETPAPDGGRGFFRAGFRLIHRAWLCPHGVFSELAASCAVVVTPLDFLARRSWHPGSVAL